MNIHLKDELKYKTMRSEKRLKRGTNKKSAREFEKSHPAYDYQGIIFSN